jgi:hypothetical protein
VRRRDKRGEAPSGGIRIDFEVRTGTKNQTEDEDEDEDELRLMGRITIV